VNNGDCVVKFVETNKQLANIFTKPLPNDRFFLLRNELGILDSHNISFFFLCCPTLFVKTNMGKYIWFCFGLMLNIFCNYPV